MSNTGIGMKRSLPCMDLSDMDNKGEVDMLVHKFARVSAVDRPKRRAFGTRKPLRACSSSTPATAALEALGHFEPDMLFFLSSASDVLIRRTSKDNEKSGLVRSKMNVCPSKHVLFQQGRSVMPRSMAAFSA